MFHFILMQFCFVILTSNNLGIRGTIKRAQKTNCPPGYFGLDCMNKCPTTCNGTCDITGQCHHCSQSGLRLPQCDQQCVDGTYGLNCANKCSQNCFEGKCDAVTGVCHWCNQIGVSLPNCTQMCQSGTYGFNCLSRCPLVCQNSCDPVNGSCSHCPVGSGQECTVNCATESNRELCEMYCPSQCLTWCNIINSHCTLCAPGYTPPFCNTTCEPNYYGNNCKNICSDRCKDDRCDPISGACFSCTEGYVGRKCNGQCITGFYGQDCDLVCPETCLNSTCDFVNGYCFQCQDGYKGPHCNELCESGKYGQNCMYNCSKNCLKSCDPGSGVCWRCMPGYRESYCNVTCQEGSYGDGCTKMCPSNCMCDHITGQCKECNSDHPGPECEEVNSKNDYTQNILVLCLYVILSLLVIISLLASTMWIYRKHFNTFWSKASWKRINSNKEINYYNSGQGNKNEQDNVNKYTNEENSFECLSSESNERHRKLVNYLRNHGKTYTPQEYDKTELRIQYLKQMKAANKPVTFHDAFKSSDQSSDEVNLAPQVNLSISHATVLDNQLDTDDRSRRNYKSQRSHTREKKKYELCTTLNASYSFPTKRENEMTSSVTLHTMKSVGEQCLSKSRCATLEANMVDRYEENKYIVESSQFLLLGGAYKQPTAAVTCTSDTKSKLSDSIKMGMNKSLLVNQDGASADSLYGITSQEFAEDQSSSEGSKSAVDILSARYDLFPFDNSGKPFVDKVRSEQTIFNEGSIAGINKNSKKFLKSPSMLDQMELKKQGSHLAKDKTQEINIGNSFSCHDKCLPMNDNVIHNNVKTALLHDRPSSAMSDYNNLDDNSSSRGQGSKQFHNSARRKFVRDIKSDKSESLSNSTLSEVEQESSMEECSSRSESHAIPHFNPSDTQSDSAQEDNKQQIEARILYRFRNKNKTSSMKKKYRKISPPKCQNSGNLSSLQSQLNKDIGPLDDSRSTYSQVDISGPARQLSVARLSTSATIKRDSPRLVRCATTRQLSPMYAVRSATVNRLTPLPTPPPEGRMSLKPVGKFSSSSSILEQDEESQ